MSEKVMKKTMTVKRLYPIELGGCSKRQKEFRRIKQPKYFDALLADDATPEEIANYTGTIEYKDRLKNRRTKI